MPSYFLWDWLVAVQRLSTSNVKPAKYVHDLGIFLDSDMSMKTHVSRTVSSCFAALRQIRSIHRSVSQPVLLSLSLSLSLVTSLVLSRLDYGSVNLIGISRHLQDRLQSVINSAARLVCSGRKYDHISPLLRDLHWLRIPERIAFSLAVLVLVFRCRSSKAPEYLARDLQWAVDDDSRKRLRFPSSHKLVVRRSSLKTLNTVGDRVFNVAARRVWNGLPSNVTDLQKHLKTSFLTVIYLAVYVFCNVSLKLWLTRG